MNKFLTFGLLYMAGISWQTGMIMSDYWTVYNAKGGYINFTLLYVAASMCSQTQIFWEVKALQKDLKKAMRI